VNNVASGLEPDDDSAEAPAERMEAVNRAAEAASPAVLDENYNEVSNTFDQSLPRVRGAGRRYIPASLKTRFVFDKHIEDGGEASVWLAHPVDEPHRQLALKVYLPTQPFDIELRHRLKNPDFRRHVPELFWYGVEHTEGIETGWEAMEYFPLGNLRKLMTRTAAGTGDAMARLRSFLIELTNLLSFWENEIGLRDLDFSPTNILVRDDGTPPNFVLADFGGLKGTGPSQRVTAYILAKIAYMAPEVRANRNDPKSPYWSLGAIFFELLTGARPLGADLTEQSRLEELILGGEPDVAAVADREWRHLIAGLLTRRPEERWGEVEVRGWLAGQRIPVRHYHRDSAFPFLEENYFEPRVLGVQMAKNWDAAIEHVLNRDLAELENWLQPHKPSQRLLRVLDACRDRKLHSDRLLAALIAELVPEHPPTFRGYTVDSAHLPKLARAALSEDGDGAPDAVIRLFESRALNAYAAAVGCEDHGRLDVLWRRNYDALTDMINGVGDVSPEIRRSLGPHKADIAALLHALSEQGAREKLRSDAVEADTETARSQSWFAHLRSRNPETSREDLLPAYHWVIVIAAPLAEAQYARAAEERRRAREAVERDAANVLKEQDGPVERYVVALGIERDVADSPLAAILDVIDPLPPLPSKGSATEQVLILVELHRMAVGRLQLVTERAAALATQRRVPADRQVESLRTPNATPPAPSIENPQHPGVDIDARSFRRLSAAALVAVIGMPLVWIYEADSYGNGPFALSDSIRVLAGIAILVAGGIVVWLWLTSAREGFDSLRSDAASRASYETALRAYQAQLDRYRRLIRQHDQAERERLAALARAKEHWAREHHIADALDTLAQRSRIAVADLTDFTMMRRLGAIASEARNTPAL
jgi:serine/threonine protein kinase